MTGDILTGKVVSLEKGSVIILYKMPELIKKKLAGNPVLPRPYFKHDSGGESHPALPQHVSSMTGKCTYPIYYQRVGSVEGNVIIRYKKTNSLIKKVP